jgi:hypothetical protein
MDGATTRPSADGQPLKGWLGRQGIQQGQNVEWIRRDGKFCACFFGAKERTRKRL